MKSFVFNTFLDFLELSYSFVIYQSDFLFLFSTLYTDALSKKKDKRKKHES